MALFKKTYTVWQLADGSRSKPNARGASKTTAKTSKWYGEFRDSDNTLRTVPLCKDKAAARAMLADLERKARRVAAGLESADPHGHKDKSLAEHLAD